MTIAEKLEYLNDTKQMIASAIEEKGIVVETETLFRDYADKILEIGGGQGETYFKYNEVELPQLLIDADRPYFFIRKNFDSTTGQYDLIMGNKPFYRPTSGYDGLYSTSTTDIKVYKFNVVTDTEWTYVGSYSSTETWSFSAPKKVLHWTSHDIHIGSVDGVDIYFAHLEPEEWKRYKVN